MMNSLTLRLLSAAACLQAVCLSHAAQIGAAVSDPVIDIGETTTVNLFLLLDASEVASVFEARFDLVELGVTANVVDVPGGPTWGSSFSNTQNGQLSLSLTSDNTGGSRLIASLDITGLAPGVFDLYLGSPAPIAAFDVPNPPFLQSVNVATTPGTLIASITVGQGVDSDGDGVFDDADNCTFVSNPLQRDSNGDGFGNLCDADLNGDCTVNAIDLGLFRLAFFSTDPDADFNGSGIVNVVDLGIFRTLFFSAPGPSALASCP